MGLGTFGVTFSRRSSTCSADCGSRTRPSVSALLAAARGRSIGITGACLAEYARWALASSASSYRRGSFRRRVRPLATLARCVSHRRHVHKVLRPAACDVADWRVVPQARRWLSESCLPVISQRPRHAATSRGVGIPPHRRGRAAGHSQQTPKLRHRAADH